MNVSEMDQFYADAGEPNRSCLIALRNLILAHDRSILETRKYGMPCFCLGKKVICYLWTDKKRDEPYILFVEGKRLSHPGLEAGDRKRMKIFRINPAHDLPLESISLLLTEAIDLSGNDILKK